MQRAKLLIIGSLCLIFIIAGIVLLDLAGTFSFSDLPFVLVFSVFFVFMLIQSGKSKVSIVISLYFLITMGLSYIQTGTSVITERLGEWFYLFFLVGILEYLKEAWSIHDSQKQDKRTDWNSYYMKRIENNRNISVHTQLDLHARWYSNWLAYIQKHIDIYNKSLHIFEIGSGMGGVLTQLSARGVSITGSDMSKKAIEAYLEKHPRTPYIFYDLENKQTFKMRYDRILAFEVLEHVHTPSLAIRTIKKLLKKGGYFVGTTPYPYDHNRNMPTHIHVHEPEYWKKEFLAQGFETVETYPMSLPPYLWRIHPKFNIVLPWYIPFWGWISTTLIIARV